MLEGFVAGDPIFFLDIPPEYKCRLPANESGEYRRPDDFTDQKCYLQQVIRIRLI